MVLIRFQNKVVFCLEAIFELTIILCRDGYRIRRSTRTIKSTLKPFNSPSSYIDLTLFPMRRSVKITHITEQVCNKCKYV